VTCPSTEELAAIYDGNLKGEQALKLRDHLASCPRCSHELNVLHQSLQSTAQAPSPPADLIAKAQEPRQTDSITPQVNLLRPKRRPTKKY
jgi:anti-sigma factor RsiW